MTGYGQFCSIARTLDLLGGRWTLLIVRELLCGSCRFNDIRRGIPRISKSVLSERLQDLLHIGAIARVDGDHGPEYVLTESGRELSLLLGNLAGWGQKWLPRRSEKEDLDLDPVLVDMHRRVRMDALPSQPLVIRFDVQGRRLPRFMLLRREEISLCAQNPGFPEPLRVRTELSVLAGWWRGDFSFLEAQRRGLVVEGPKGLARTFPNLFERYQFADIGPARRNRKTSTTSRRKRDGALARASVR
ncbi:MAG: helix-turn-helix domain-containing protein [Rhizomicrobium sp.]|jgi:DNA-binding HxlR family transcriptional regulator